MKQKIESIQALRGLAAMLICCFHMRSLLNSKIEWGNIIFSQASVGVLVFFVISGVIIVVTTQKADTSFAGIAKFLAKRILRIVPLYYLLTLVLLIVIGKLGIFVSRHSDLLIKSFLFIPTGLSSMGGAYGMPVLKVGWTLNYEIFFYMLVTLSLLFGKWRWSVVICGISILVWALPLMAYGYILFSPAGKYPFGEPYLQMITNPLMLCFLVGVAIGLFYCSAAKLPSQRIANIGLVVSIGFLVFSLYANMNPNFKYCATLLSIGVMVLSLMIKERLRPMHINAYLVKLGDISFSIYMSHTVVAVFMSDTLRHWGVPNSGIFFINLVSIILISLLLYAFIEKKMTAWLLKRLNISK